MKWKIVFKESSLEVGMKFNLQQKCADFIQEKLSKFHREKKSNEYLYKKRSGERGLTT